MAPKLLKRRSIKPSEPDFSDRPCSIVTKAITSRTTCCLCGSALRVLAKRSQQARVVTTNGVAKVNHYKKRCTNDECGKTHSYNYVQVGSDNVNFITNIGDVGDIFFVSGTFGFSTAYIEQFWNRVVRCSLSTIGETEALNDYLSDSLNRT